MDNIQTPDQRESDLNFMMEYENCKSAFFPKEEATVHKAYNKEVNWQWMIPIPLESVKDLEDSGEITISVLCKIQ